MIHTKEDLKRYLYADREAQPPHPNIILRHFDPIYRIKTLDNARFFAHFRIPGLT